MTANTGTPAVAAAHRDNIATLTIDDGKANAFNHELIAAVTGMLNDWRDDASVRCVVIRGRTGVFSAGFDLKVMGQGPAAQTKLVRAGMALGLDLVTYPKPVLLAMTGHTLAFGAILALTGDVRIGCDKADFKYGLNETAIGMVLPWFAVELCRYRLAAPWRDVSAVSAQILTGAQAQAAGYLDQLVAVESFDQVVAVEADRLAQLDAQAFAATKARLRGALWDRLKSVGQD